MRMCPCPATASRTLLWLFASAWSLGIGGCLPGDLEVTTTANAGIACGGSSPPFFVPALQTVRVLESLVCDADAGLTSTLYPGPSP